MTTNRPATQTHSPDSSRLAGYLRAGRENAERRAQDDPAPDPAQLWQAAKAAAGKR